MEVDWLAIMSDFLFSYPKPRRSVLSQRQVLINFKSRQALWLGPEILWVRYVVLQPSFRQRTMHLKRVIHFSTTPVHIKILPDHILTSCHDGFN